MPRTAQDLLADFDQLTRQLADATAFRDQLEHAVATATDALDLADEKGIAALQTKKTQLELAPRKLAQLEARRAALEREATEILEVERGAIGGLVRANEARLTRHVTALLLPFCLDERDAEQTAQQTHAVLQTGSINLWDAGGFGLNPVVRLRNAVAAHEAAAAKAKELAKLAA